MKEGQLYIRIQSGMFKLSTDIQIPLPLSLQTCSNPYAASIFQYKMKHNNFKFHIYSTFMVNDKLMTRKAL